MSFNFPNFSPNDPSNTSINFQGDSTRTGNFINFVGNSGDTSDRKISGRATYSEAIKLWNATTGWQADFDTNFSFIIDRLNKDKNNAGDGLTFFLAPFGSILPTNSSGGALGLLSQNVPQNNRGMNQIVAVEFDSFKNTWDPSSDHVGININSVVSVVTVSLANGTISDGRKANARITYNSITKNLSVYLTYSRNPVFNGNSTLYHVLDLSKVLPELITVGFSAATGVYTEVHQVLSWHFNSTSELIEVSQDNKTAEGKTGGERQTDGEGISKKTDLAVGLGVGLGVFACALGFALFIWLKKRPRLRNFDDDAENSDVSMDNAFEKGTGPKRFSYSELVYATNNFDEGGKLGHGGFGRVYKGFLSDLGVNVAVKRVSRGSDQGKKEYQAEVKIISQLRHRNLVQLIGWCHKRNELLLLYEFMPNRSLDKHLFGGENTLRWEVRYKIALGLASAVLYLHELWEQCVLHRDIKASNVMLDSDFNAKLGDFGLARLVDHGLGSHTTMLAGTLGYLAPECILTGKSSKESDVYSFGIVALEIACGRRQVEATKGVLIELVWGLYGRGKLLDAADERLKLEFNELEMEQLMVVGLWCAHPDSKLRPSATQVINVLKFESPLPILPPELPTPVYLPIAQSVPNFSSLVGLTDTVTGLTNTLTGR
ncbi:hypothetical protein C5167_029812 [Papaver somniferum]|nr:hypothetical protein C5167_029812 [Papaver somniferum]